MRWSREGSRIEDRRWMIEDGRLKNENGRLEVIGRDLESTAFSV
jgi:hypothetical protein